MSATEVIKAKAPNPTAEKVSPETKKEIIKGIETRAGPMIGRMPAKIASAVSKRALGTLKTKNPAPIIAPCIIPTIIWPYKTDEVISLVELNNFFSISAEKGNKLLI